MTAQLLEEALGKVVLTRLKGGRSLRGKLKGFDQHLNLVLEDAEEISADNVKKLGSIIVRGDNIIIISPSPAR